MVAGAQAATDSVAVECVKSTSFLVPPDAVGYLNYGCHCFKEMIDGAGVESSGDENKTVMVVAVVACGKWMIRSLTPEVGR